MGYYGRLSEAEQAVMAAEFMDFAAPLLENPDVQSLSRNLHHRGKTRLEHVKEVAWLGLIPKCARMLALESMIL